MAPMARRQAEVLEELQEWLEDVASTSIGSRVVLLTVPAGWGRSTVLAEFRAVAASPGRDRGASDDGPACTVVAVDGGVPGDRAVQAVSLHAALAPAAQEATPSSRARGPRLPPVSSGPGPAAPGLSVPGLGPAGGAAAMLASRLLRAKGPALDDGPAGAAGAVARAARAVAARSVRLPVVVVIDDADQLDPGLARAMITGLAARRDGRVLVVVAVSPGSPLAVELAQAPGPDLGGRVREAAAEAAMDDAARADLLRELRPDLTGETAARVAEWTGTFAQVLAVAAGQEAGAEPPVDIDAAVDALLERAVPSREAVILAWAGGTLHERQAAACLHALDASRADGDIHVRRDGALAALADPLSPQWASEVAALPPGQRASLAAAALAAVPAVAADPGARLADRVVARLAVHQVRADVPDELRDQLPPVQSALARGLEALGDPEAARRVAREAIAGAAPGTAGRRDLLLAYLRLARPAAGETDPLAGEAAALVLSGTALSGTALSGTARSDPGLPDADLSSDPDLSGPSPASRSDAGLPESARPFGTGATGPGAGLEARVWAAAHLLAQPRPRERVVALAGPVAAELERQGRGDAADQWRLVLAFHAGQAGLAPVAERLLSPLLASRAASREKPARAVLLAVAAPRAQTRLQVVLLQAELDVTPAAADAEFLRLHAGLARAYSDLGMYARALAHGQRELALRASLQFPGHPEALRIRSDIATWTGQGGDPETALERCTALLPDQERALGPDHGDTLTTRSNIATWTGRCGDPVAAHDLLAVLLPDMARVHGPAHPDTLTTRASIAAWASACGHAQAARESLTAVLLDMEQALGPDHHRTLTTRINHAISAGEGGDAAAARDLFGALRPDLERVLGPEHPETLTARSHLATWTGRGGDPAIARDQFTLLLPDLERVLGYDHPDTLAARASEADWTGELGDAAGARELFEELLPDVAAAFGPEHPSVLAVRSSVASWTGRAGDAAGARDQFVALLPDLERVLGPDHLDTLTARGNVTTWAGASGDVVAARDLAAALLPQVERVLGPDHLDTLAVRSNLAAWTGRGGDPAGALALFAALLPDLERVLGPDHPHTLAARSSIARLTPLSPG